MIRTIRLLSEGELAAMLAHVQARAETPLLVRGGGGWPEPNGRRDGKREPNGRLTRRMAKPSRQNRRGVGITLVQQRARDEAGVGVPELAE